MKPHNAGEWGDSHSKLLNFLTMVILVGIGSTKACSVVERQGLIDDRRPLATI